MAEKVSVLDLARTTCSDGSDGIFSDDKACPVIIRGLIGVIGSSRRGRRGRLKCNSVTLGHSTIASIPDLSQCKPDPCQSGNAVPMSNREAWQYESLSGFPLAPRRDPFSLR